MLTVPLIFGSSTKLRPVISAAALTTASMSALTKFSVTVSSAADETRATASRSPAAICRRGAEGGEGDQIDIGAGPAGRAAIGAPRRKDRGR
jgi:hypothetical protein